MAETSVSGLASHEGNSSRHYSLAVGSLQANTTDYYDVIGLLGNETLSSTNGNITSAGNGTDIYAFNVKNQVIFELVLFILIVVGNSAVLVAIGLSKRGQRSRMNFFIMHLAIADLSSGLFSVLPWSIWKLTKEWYAGDVMCRLLRYLQSTVTYASTYMLVSMSIDRLDAIARPLNFTGSGTRGKILVILGWSLAVLFSVPMLFINRVSRRQDGTIQCIIDLPEQWHWQLYVTSIFLAVLVFPAVIIIVCYCIIIYVIWSKSKYLATSDSKPKDQYRKFTSKRNGTGNMVCTERVQAQSSTSSRGVIPQAKIRTVKMTLLIVLMFIICWSPFFIFDLLYVYGYVSHSQSTVAINVFIQSLAPLNSLANPIIYGCFSSRICSNLRRIRACDVLCSRLLPCCPGAPQERRQSTATASVTGYTSMAEEARNLNDSLQNKRRPSNTHMIRSELTEQENEILMNTISNENLVQQ